MNAVTAVLSLVFASVVASSVLAHPTQGPKLPILKIEESTLAVPLVRQDSEEAIFVANSSQSGFARVTQTGLTVQRGTSGTLRFRMNALAVESETLASLDEEFRSSLSVSERLEYDSLRSQFNKDLNIPFLSWLGLDLRKRVSREQMVDAYNLRENYNTQSSIVKQILENFQVQTIEISGSLTAYGTSFIPTTVLAFIRIARITLQDGSTLTVVSQSGSDLAAADAGGNVVPSSGGTINTLMYAVIEYILF